MHTNITEDNITDLVRHFYLKARRDPVIGPIFTTHVGHEEADWTPHLARMVDFWSSVLLKTGRYTGRPPLAHLKITELTDQHFDRWLDLFELTCRDLYERPVAEHIIAKSHMIRGGLARAIVLARAGQASTQQGQL